MNCGSWWAIRIYWVDWCYRCNWYNWGRGNTFFSVPDISSFADDAGNSIEVWRGRACSNTAAIIIDMESSTLTARSSNQEEIVIAQVVDAASCGKSQISIWEWSTQTKWSSIIRNNESIESMESDVVVWNSDRWCEDKWGDWCVFIVHIGSCNQVKNEGIINNVWNEQGMDLGGWGWWNDKGDSLSCDVVGEELYFERCVIWRVNSHWANFESIEESQSFGSSDLARRERNKSNNFLSWETGWKWGSVYLVVSSIKLRWSFSQKWKTDSCPSCVSPVSPNNEGNNSVAIWTQSFNRKEEIIARCAQEIINGYVTQLVHMATLGEQLKAVVRV